MKVLITKQLLNDLIVCLQELKYSLGKEDNLKNITDNISKILNNYKRDNINDLVSLRILNTINMLDISLGELKSLGKENYNTIKANKSIPEQYKMINIHKKEFYTKSVKFSYAIRVSLGITISAFIADYFKFPEGRWIYFTAFAIIIPIYELSKKKLKDRIFATLVGGAIIVIVFTLFKNMLIRMLVIMAAGYLRAYTSTYRYGTIYTTICAIGAAAMTGGAVVLTIDRIVFVIFGTIIAIIINRFVLPVRMKDANKELLGTYREVLYKMLSEVYEGAINKNNNTHEMDTLLLVTTMIEERLVANNGNSIIEENSSYFDKLRVLIIDIYQLYRLVKRSEIKHNNDMVEDLKLLSNLENINIDNEIKSVEEHIKTAEGMDNKIIFAIIRSLLSGIKELKDMNKVLAKDAIE